MTEAGRELDALIAEKVMGWHMAKKPAGEGWPPSRYWQSIEARERPPRYSENISAAWQVVEHMERTRPNEFMLWAEVGQWGAEFDNDLSRFAQTAPLAICLAALATLEE